MKPGRRNEDSQRAERRLYMEVVMIAIIAIVLVLLVIDVARLDRRR